ncbi:hypothetical protein T01_11226 [Trichinella spiralis]|nr:hypothetical protein T01_11226 [Trichinella spiralis]
MTRKKNAQNFLPSSEDRCLPEKRFVRVIIDCGHKSPTDDLRVLGVLFKLAVLICAWSSLVQCHQRLP